MKSKIPTISFIFFALVYANQAMSGFAGQSVYYMTREYWKLSASTIGIIGFITGLAWCIKILFGIIADKMEEKGYPSKNVLITNYLCIVLSLILLIILPLSIAGLIVFGFLINFCLAFNDVICDKSMVILETKNDLGGRSQSVQWIAFGVVAIIVAFGGAKVASSFSEIIACKVSYGLMLVLPILTIIYLKFFMKSNVQKAKNNVKIVYTKLLEKRFVIALLFIACLQFCPSFGIALNIKAREDLMVSKMFLGYLSMLGTGLGIIGYALYYYKFYKVPIIKLLKIVIILSAITNLFYLYIPNKWFLVVYGLIFGAFGGISFLTLLNLFVKIIPKGLEGLGYALVTSVSNLCSNGSGYIGGILYDAIGYNGNVLLSSALTLLTVLFIPFLKINEENTNE